MLSNFFQNFSHYFARRLTYQIKELYLSVTLLDFATSLVAIFEPIYLYTLGYSIKQILIFCIAIYVIYFFTLPLGGKIARLQGYEHSILYSTPFLIFYYIFLFAVPYHPLFLAAAAVSLALQKMLYWPGYHSDFARFSVDGERGRQVSNRVVIGSLVSAIGPLIGGLVLTFFGFKILFIVVVILLLASNIPLLSTKEIFTPIPFSYPHAYRRLFRKENRRKFFAYLGFGEELIFLVLWPIFIYTIIKNYFSIGMIVAAATLVTIFVILFVGRITDKSNKHSVLRFGTFFSAISWLFRMLVRGGLGIFLVDSFYRISRNILGIPLTAITYERAGKASVMKSVIFFEMALTLGKLLAASSILVLLFFIPTPNGLVWNIIFGVAGAMTLFYALL
jgi:hypothetical protein